MNEWESDIKRSVLFPWKKKYAFETLQFIQLTRDGFSYNFGTLQESWFSSNCVSHKEKGRWDKRNNMVVKRPFHYDCCFQGIETDRFFIAFHVIGLNFSWIFLWCSLSCGYSRKKDLVCLSWNEKLYEGQTHWEQWVFA